jgi:hypothetical protein
VSVEIEVRGGASLHEVAARLREAARKDLRTELLQAFRRAGRSLLDDEKSTAASLPIRGFPHPGRKRRYSGPSTAKNLRAQVAAATGLEVTLSGDDPRVRVKVSSAKMPAGMRWLPRKLNSDRGWRHPVLGNRHVWVKQVGKEWFEPTGRKHFDDFRREAQQALDRVADKIAGG